MRAYHFLPLASLVSAHTIMQAFNGNAQGSGIYMPSDDSVRGWNNLFLIIIMLTMVLQFIADVNSNSIACNGPPVQYFKSSSVVHTVQAGSQVTGAWLHTLTSSYTMKTEIKTR